MTANSGTDTLEVPPCLLQYGDMFNNKYTLIREMHYYHSYRGRALLRETHTHLVLWTNRYWWIFTSSRILYMTLNTSLWLTSGGFTQNSRVNCFKHAFFTGKTILKKSNVRFNFQEQTRFNKLDTYPRIKKKELNHPPVNIHQYRYTSWNIKINAIISINSCNAMTTRTVRFAHILTKTL